MNFFLCLNLEEDNMVIYNIKKGEQFMYTIREIEEKMHTMVTRKDIMQELCRRRDKDTFDIVYGASEDLREWDSSLERRLKERAVEGKRTYLDRTKSSYAQAENFDSLSRFIEDIYCQAFKIMMDKIKRLERGY